MLGKDFGDKNHDLNCKSLLIKFIGYASQLGVDTVAWKLEKRYKDVSNKQIQKLWTVFDTLGIDPIVLTNFRRIERILSLLQSSK